MARPREFSADLALETAMELFRRLGYGATTYSRIGDEANVGVRSLVNVFGDKETLFLRVLDFYRRREEAELKSRLSPPSVRAVADLFRSFADDLPSYDPRHQGCLMVNTAFDLPEAGERAAEAVGAFREMQRACFHAALEADAIARAGVRADFLVAALWGAEAQVRLAGNRRAAADAATIVAESADGWR